MYNSSLATPVSYSVSSPSDAPMSSTFGSSFMKSAGGYDGTVTIGRISIQFSYRSNGFHGMTIDRLYLGT